MLQAWLFLTSCDWPGLGPASVKEAVIPGAWSQPLVTEEKLDIIAGTGGALAGMWPGGGISN